MAAQDSFDYTDLLTSIAWEPIAPQSYSVEFFSQAFQDGYDAGFAAGVASAVVGGTIEQLTASPLTRWDAIVSEISITNSSLYIFVVIGSNWIVARDPALVSINNPSGFTPLFQDRSSISGTTVTLLPAGGWWSTSFEVKYVAGVEIT